MFKKELKIILAALIVFCGFATSAYSLNNNQRKKFLEAYSPIIFKAADEGQAAQRGHDWILNFFFDGDQNFSNNSLNIVNLLSKIKQPDFAAKLNPTLYTFLLEFTDDNHSTLYKHATKSLIMVYNIYHARDSDSIHDWERFEIRLDNVDTTPLKSEVVSYAVITNHHTHLALNKNQIQFMTTPTGKHALIFQAKWSNSKWGPGSPRKNELHFVKDSINKILTSSDAMVAVPSEKKPIPFHYLYVVNGDFEAINQFNASILTTHTADQLYAGVANTPIKLSAVKRVRYELQDVADILPSHLEPKSKNWFDVVPILMDESPIRSSDMSVVVSTNSDLSEFYNSSKSERPGDNVRGGYPKKNWFWGTYIFNGENFTDEALHQTERIRANTKPAKLVFKGELSHYFWQHDYFAHDKEGNGHWLSYGWNTEARAGFDGRWNQLFEN